MSASHHQNQHHRQQASGAPVQQQMIFTGQQSKKVHSGAQPAAITEFSNVTGAALIDHCQPSHQLPNAIGLPQSLTINKMSSTGNRQTGGSRVLTQNTKRHLGKFQVIGGERRQRAAKAFLVQDILSNLPTKFKKSGRRDVDFDQTMCADLRGGDHLSTHQIASIKKTQEKEYSLAVGSQEAPKSTQRLTRLQRKRCL